MGAFNSFRAARYSTARLSLGPLSTVEDSPAQYCTACCLARAKGRPRSSPSRRPARNRSVSRQAAVCSNGASSPHSLPKASMSATPVSFSRETLPRAKRCAPDAAHGVGSSSTRFTPLSTASRARCHLSHRAGSPRWTKFPLMQQIKVQSSSNFALILSNKIPCPTWKGLYSATMPTFFIIITCFFHTNLSKIDMVVVVVLFRRIG